MGADLVAFVLSVISVRRVEGFDLPLVQNIFDLHLSNVGTEGGFFRHHAIDAVFEVFALANYGRANESACVYRHGVLLS